jgi:peptidoglycan-associated lipoprotein
MNRITGNFSTANRSVFFILLLVLALVLVPAGCKKKAPVSDPSDDAGRQAAQGTESRESLDDGDIIGMGTDSLNDGDLGALGRSEPDLKDVYFAFDRYDLNITAQTMLRENAEWLQANGSVQIIVEGHCDERGSNEYNLALGERRAEAVKNYLVSLGISDSRMRAISYGEEMPLDPAGNEAAWAKNRRGHLLVVSQ